VTRKAKNAFDSKNLSENTAKHHVLLVMQLEEIFREECPGGSQIELPTGFVDGDTYFTKPREADPYGLMQSRFNNFPIVLNPDGSPWAEATALLVSLLSTDTRPDMQNYLNLAADWAAYRRFLLENPHIDWLAFPEDFFKRPTYIFHGYLLMEIANEGLGAKTAKRRMNNVVKLYNLLLKDKAFETANSPWQEKTSLAAFDDAVGIRKTKLVTSTNLSISVPRDENPFGDETIFDDGELRPLSPEEQKWVVKCDVASNTDPEFASDLDPHEFLLLCSWPVI